MGVVADVQTHLEAQNLIGGATGWASFRRRVNDSADQQVVISEDGGPAPEFPAASGLGSAALADPGVQVFVRGSPWDGDSTQAKAEAIRDELHGLVDTTISGTRYIRIRAMTPEPVFLGFDDNGRPEHTISFRLMRDED